MSGEHHIHRQSLILEAPGLKTGDKWHDRLARLHESRLLPLLEEAFDAADDGSTRYIDRLELIVTISDPERLEEEVTRGIRSQLSKALESERKRSTRNGPIHFGQILHYLITGNFPWGASTITDLRALAGNWLSVATEREWAILFTEWARQPAAFLGRCTQVQGGFTERCWAELNAMDSDADRDITSESLPPTNPEEWKAKLRGSRLGVVETTDYDTGKMDDDRVFDSEPTRKKQEVSAIAWHPMNSGIILLHPYLAYLLKQVECEVLSRAATLFHYLVWGTTECGEWDLPLTKLLLGLHPDDYLPPASYLGQSDRAAADELLEGVIGHWTALKNTSIHVLRDGFLQRRGRLTKEGPGWRLTVEEKPQDLLLDRLPWSIGMIRSKRMTATLCVDWR